MHFQYLEIFPKFVDRKTVWNNLKKVIQPLFTSVFSSLQELSKASTLIEQQKMFGSCLKKSLPLGTPNNDEKFFFNSYYLGKEDIVCQDVYDRFVESLQACVSAEVMSQMLHLLAVYQVLSSFLYQMLSYHRFLGLVKQSSVSL
jgi:hypothetical protein